MQKRKKTRGPPKKTSVYFQPFINVGFFCSKLANGRSGQRKVISGVFLDQQKENVL